MRYACREVQGMADLLCHWFRANIQCGHRNVVCLFKQETSEVARWRGGQFGNEVGTPRRDIEI